MGLMVMLSVLDMAASSMVNFKADLFLYCLLLYFISYQLRGV